MSERLPTSKPSQNRMAHRTLGGALDALIRGVRADLVLAEGMASRVASLWRDEGLSPLVFEPTVLRIAGDEGLCASRDHGRWILPAFMAGLREVRARGAIAPDNLRRLAARIAALESSATSIAEFQEWLWADGAEGFDVKLELSFVEMLAARGQSSDGTRAGFAAVRAETLFSVDGDAVSMAVADLDLAALRPEMQISLDAYAGAVAARGLEVSGSTLRALGGACDDASAWAVSEVTAIIELPAARSAVPPQRLAGRLRTLVASRCDARTFGLLGMLTQTDDPYVRAVLGALETQSAGRDIARGTVLDDPSVRAALVAVLGRLPAGIAVEIVEGLLDRVAETDRAVATLADVWLALGAPEFGELANRAITSISETAFRARTGTAMARVAVRAGAGSREVAQLAERLPEAAAMTFLLGMPATLSSLASDAIDRVIASATDLDAVVRLVAHVPSPARATAVLARLAKDRGAQWQFATVAVLLRTALANGAGPAVVGLARNRRVPDAMRLTTLDALADDPALQLAAARWTPAALLDSSAVRHAAAAIRARHRDQS